MNYKVIIFKCGCKFIWLNGTERRYKVCPEHRRPVGKYVLWCRDCGLKITAAPKAGYRQKLCNNCRIEWQRKVSRDWARKHPNYWTGRDTNKYRKEKPQETQGEKDRRQLNAWYNHMREIFKPVWEGIV